jgi:8-oxo-dGTP pyrophosphatase MutT (NUDIX family)
MWMPARSRRARYRTASSPVVGISAPVPLQRRGLLDVYDIPYRELRRFPFVSYVCVQNTVSVGLQEHASNYLSIQTLIDGNGYMALKDMLVRFLGYKTVYNVVMRTVSNPPASPPSTTGERTARVCKGHMFFTSTNKLVRAKHLDPGMLLRSSVADRLLEVVSVSRGEYTPVAEISTSRAAAVYSIQGALSGNLNGHRKYLVVISHGLLLFRTQPDGTDQILLVQGRWSMPFLDLVHSRRYNQPREIVDVFLSEITRTERQMIMTMPYEELWRAIDCPGSERDVPVREEGRTTPFAKGKRKFENDRVRERAEQIETQFEEAEFGLPKGRLSPHETPLACCHREVLEETGLSPDKYELIEPHHPIREVFVGTNGVSYSHVYLCARLRPGVSEPDERVQTDREIARSLWVTQEAALGLLRPYDEAKRATIERGFARHAAYLKIAR